MAYKVSYKVVSEQGEQLKKTAKDMDGYVNQLNQIISKLGSDELLQSVRTDLGKFKQQLEEEKTILNLAGQVIADVVQSYTGAEKKNVQKVDRTKAHNRDFYKRPVTVASAGGGGATASATASAAATVNVNVTTGGGTSAPVSGFSGFGGGAAGASMNAAHIGGAGAAAAAKAVFDKAADAPDVVKGIGAAVAGVAVAGASIGALVAADKKSEEDAEGASV